ncbi:hypothetical protein ACFPK9_01090 [Rubritalea spongiae]|uniref:DUF3102 domain-containing protein n=1 Tax=Rubritalea spongiae TaxID=430797 RepID=A0ABW5DZD6_9BACT
MPKTITLPNPSELALNIESELHKLPTEAAHNHFHNLATKGEKIQEQAKVVSLVATILCGLELDHIQKELKQKGEPQSRNGSPKINWKQWVSENCEYSHKTVTKYIKVIKCAREGLIDGINPELIPNEQPSKMNKQDLQDTCSNLANALQGFGSLRQLYLELEVIKTPQRVTIHENRNTKGSTAKSDNQQASEPTAPDIDLERQDAKAAIIPTLKPLDDFLKLNKHTYLERTELEQLDQALQAYRDILKPFLK